MDGVAEVGGPEAVGGEKEEGADLGVGGGLAEELGGVDVRGPEEVLVELAVGELGGTVVDDVEAVLGEGAAEEGEVAEVALNTVKAGVMVFVRLKVDVNDEVSFVQQLALENSAEEAGGSRD